MDSSWIKIEDLTDLLMEKSGLDMKDLAKTIGISRVTLTKWKSGIVRRINTKPRNTLATALKSQNWGFRIGSFRGSEIEILFDNPPIQPDQEKMELQNQIDHLQHLLNKTLSENFVLKEKIEKYEGTKQ